MNVDRMRAKIRRHDRLLKYLQCCVREGESDKFLVNLDEGSEIHWDGTLFASNLQKENGIKTMVKNAMYGEVNDEMNGVENTKFVIVSEMNADNEKGNDNTYASDADGIDGRNNSEKEWKTESRPKLRMKPPILPNNLFLATCIAEEEIHENNKK